MTNVAISPENLKNAIAQALGEKVRAVKVALDEVTIEVAAKHYLEAMRILREAPGCRFEQLIDLCGVDYSAYKDREQEGLRYCVVSHLLSVSLNQRLRVKVFCPDDDFPVVASLTTLWEGAGWFEREAFDLFGIVFDGHGDLRRILTDYGFIGHPFRKDFPLSGNVEMRYDADQRRVIYEPVTIEPREVTPRIIREDKYGGLH
ncbi:MULTISPECIES: NADH-quinone oxidoreductase subunit C [Simplicispira]|jgi:NADH-quinone oxidoreductase subunit C|uniref:NADH-quinone oxidoreductase subunit C n=1 Tax=Simplicispira metamorpha TaxID=80881 RepID=A0A4R2NG18_9BURK|nr:MULTISPECIES: NADH-quinone oxidoreductase subunit C [Simplicispira]MBP7412741.1 NADH-quinone oxidoreductase subunit C [Giesbergeria sp.]MBP9941814.1 NADH-quinone oxidoreductase subunit C [Comamonas sp.]MDD2690398.1 NADH-quinone oxidoreductase subunit C [Simplicispira sp.]TCP20054.1 NADH dehydrogenase subunit C [Simplicispira metamorpha]